MLVGDHVVLVLRVNRLMLGWDVNLVRGEFVLAEIFEEIGVAGAVEVNVREG